MNRQSKNVPRKPKKGFLGIALGVASLVSAGISTYSSIKATKDAKRQANNLTAEQEAERQRLIYQQRVNGDAINQQEYASLYDTQSTYAKGGTLPKGIKYAGGGVYQAVGPSHKEGGIKIAPNVEIEGDEALFQDGGSVKVLSKQPIAGGVSPAEVAIKTGNIDVARQMYKNQENMKNKLGYKDDGSKMACGGSVKKKAKLGTLQDEIELIQAKNYGVTAPSAPAIPTTYQGPSNVVASTPGSTGGISSPNYSTIAGGVGLASSLATGISNLYAAKNQVEPRNTRPVLARAPRLNTNINTDAQQTSVIRSRDRINTAIEDNTASDQVRLSRIQRNELNARDTNNQIVESAENTSRSIMNQNAIAEAQTQAANADRITGATANYNSAMDAYNIRKTQNVSGALANIGSTISSAANWYADSRNTESYQQQQLNTLLATDTNNSSIPLINQGNFDDVLRSDNSARNLVQQLELQGDTAKANALRARYKMVNGKDLN